MSKYILIHIDEDITKLEDVLYVLKDLLSNAYPVYDCTGEDLYYGFEYAAENLNNVGMIAIGVKEDDSV